MLKLKLAIVAMSVAMVVPAGSVLRAEKPQEAPTAPLPSQILTAQNAFIANGSGEIHGCCGMYNDLYADMKTWGRYQLVRSPGEADIVVQLNLAQNILGPPGMELELRDAKTNTLLWAIYEPIRKSSDSGLDEVVEKLVEDLKALIASPAAK